MNAVAVAILTDARKRVEAGWVQGRAYNEAGDVCAGHAIDLSYYDLAHKMGASMDDRSDAVALLSQAVEQGAHRQWPGGIPGWNDHDSRTKAEVLAAFDEAIRLGKGERRAAYEVKVEAIWSPIVPPPTTYDFFIEPATVEPIKASLVEKVKQLVGV